MSATTADDSANAIALPVHPPLRKVVETVARLCGVTAKEIRANNTGLREARRISHPRQLAMHLCWREHDNRASLNIVAHHFARHHTSVLAARKRIKERIGQSAEWCLIHDTARACLADPALLDTLTLPLPYPGWTAAKEPVAHVVEPEPRRPSLASREWRAEIKASVERDGLVWNATAKPLAYGIASIPRERLMAGRA